MHNTPIDIKLREGLKTYANYIAMVIHNTVEDFQSKNPSDEQMKRLDSTIVNAIYTALYAFEYYKCSDNAREFVEYNLSKIPQSWEEPEFLEGFEEKG